MADRGRGRGRGLLLLAQQRAKEEKAKKEEAEATSANLANVTTDSSSVPVGRGRASNLRDLQKGAEVSAASSPTPSESGRSAAAAPPPETLGAAKEPAIPGRGRGLMAKIGGPLTSAASAPPRTIGRVTLDDAESFKSDEFSTSSRIGVMEEGKVPIELDVKELARKLEAIDSIDSSKSSIKPDASCQSPEFSSNPQTYRGEGGKVIEVTSNYMRLEVDEEFGIFEYEVTFAPRVDARDERYAAVNQHREVIGMTKSFDGNKLFLPKKMKESVVKVSSKHSKTGEDIQVTFRLKRRINPGERESIYIYNVIFHKIMRTLKFAQSARKGNFFDAKAAKDIKVMIIGIQG